ELAADLALHLRLRGQVEVLAAPRLADHDLRQLVGAVAVGDLLAQLEGALPPLLLGELVIGRGRARIVGHGRLQSNSKEVIGKAAVSVAFSNFRRGFSDNLTALS